MKREADPIDVVIEPGAPVDLFLKLIKAVSALTERGHTVSVTARPRNQPGDCIPVELVPAKKKKARKG